MSDQPAVLRITEPGEVAQVVPHLLGFQPERYWQSGLAAGAVKG